MPEQNRQTSPILFGTYFSYSAQFSDVDAGISQTVQVQIQADSDFKIMNMTAALFNSADGAIFNIASNPIGLLVTCQLTDTGSGANLFDKSQPLINVAGTGTDPYILPMPRIMSANSQLSVAITNASTTANVGVYITFGGQKLFYAGT